MINKFVASFSGNYDVHLNKITFTNSAANQVVDDEAVFDTGCQTTTLAKKLFTPAYLRTLPTRNVRVATGVVAVSYLLDELHVIVGDPDTWLSTWVTLRRPLITEQSLLGMEVIKNYRWVLEPANDGSFGVVGSDVADELTVIR